MALTVYTSKDNQWREYVNPLRGMTLEWIVSLIEQGERGAFADIQWFYQAMERSDALIATVLMRRRAALLACEWHVRPEENPTDTVLAVEQAAKADAVMVSEALQRDFDKPMLAAAFPGWPVETGFELRMEDVAEIAGVAV